MPSILVVEDDDLLNNMYQSIFSEHGFEVHSAADGLSALNLLASWLPDVMLVDIVLPKMDGLALLREIKSKPKLNGVPVVVITNLTDTVVANSALEYGAAKFVQKSEHHPQEVVAIVNEVLGEAKHE